MLNIDLHWLPAAAFGCIGCLRLRVCRVCGKLVCLVVRFLYCWCIIFGIMLGFWGLFMQNVLFTFLHCVVVLCDSL